MLWGTCLTLIFPTSAPKPHWEWRATVKVELEWECRGGGQEGWSTRMWWVGSREFILVRQGDDGRQDHLWAEAPNPWHTLHCPIGLHHRTQIQGLKEDNCNTLMFEALLSMEGLHRSHTCEASPDSHVSNISSYTIEEGKFLYWHARPYIIWLPGNYFPCNPISCSSPISSRYAVLIISQIH